MTDERDWQPDPDLPPIVFEATRALPTASDVHPPSDGETKTAESAALLQKDVRERAHTLLGAAKRSICICSINLDPWLYDSDEALDACIKLLAHQSRSRLRILVKETQHLERHRLIKLAQRLTSNCSIRQLNPDHPFERSGYLIVDDRLLFVQHLSAQDTDAERVNARLIQRSFDHAWDHSIDAPNLRSFIL
ncbi:DUF7931 domain-containing protein [Pseudomonas matsuisoli]|uniref:DUF7931 domain-containing protein n=1 Tax=Pseudomonas matsuisoli TaxID=1515666 RepID=A0A917PM54_9PSED|nr:hypothetical protein [Pseudomonas matsuisoli]GGJ84315.1 hypothetical protein GCM10009304_07870 [Pseudomonas matsuisoli]